MGDYSLKEWIGAGGMGLVFLAEHDEIGRPAVVKLINPLLAATDPDAARRFSAEIKTLGRLQHSGIAQVYDGGVHTDPPETGGKSFPYLAMEYVRGDPITVYQKERTLELPELLEKFCQACGAIDHANTLRVIHCDLKPQHIVINTEGFPRVLDFGIARLFDPSLPREAQLMVAGTPATMSPEQVTDELGRIGPWTDVYALGIILYELLAGRRPYEVPVGPLEAILRAIVNAEPTPLGELDSDYRGKLEDIVSKAIRKDPQERYQSVNALEGALRGYLDGITKRREQPRPDHKPCNLPLVSIGTLFKGREAFLDDLRTRLGTRQTGDGDREPAGRARPRGYPFQGVFVWNR